MAIIWWTSYCGNRSQYDAFWSDNLTINTYNPDFSNCFQNTVLLWTSYAFLYVPTPFYLANLLKRETCYTWREKSVLNIVKLVLSACIALLAVIDLFYTTIKTEERTIERITPFLTIITYVLVALFIHLEFKKAVHTSGILFLFLLVGIICGIFSFRSSIIQWPLNTRTEVALVLNIIHFPLVCLLWISVLFVDKKAFHPTIKQTLGKNKHVLSETTPLLGYMNKEGGKENETMSENVRESPELTASFWSIFSMMWLTRLFYEGFKKTLVFEDIYKLPQSLTCEDLLPSFLKEWDKEEAKIKKNSSKNNFTEFDKHKKNSYEMNEPHREDESSDQGAMPLIKAIIRSVGWSYGLSIVYRFITMIIIYFNPLILGIFLQLLESQDEYVWKGVVLSVMMFLDNSLHTFLVQRYCYWAYIFGIQMRTVVTGAVYRKSLRLSSAARRQTTIGQIVNLMAVDAQRLQDIPLYMTAVWTTPILLVIATSLLWYNIGPASLGGVALMVLILVPFNGILVANKIKQLQVHQMQLKDERVKIANEVLSGIKVLKLYGWEPSFQSRIEDIREDELRYLKKANYYSAGSAMLWNTSTYLVSMTIFLTFLYISSDNILTPHTAFVTTALVNTLNFPLSFMPAGVMYLGQTWIALKRIQKFLLMEELRTDAIQFDQKSDAAVKVEKGVFSWGGSTQPSLKIDELHIPEGGLVAVVGHVGSGKSSLVSAMLGDMTKKSGNVIIKHPVAYVPQQAWIQNTTVRRNICFSKPYKDTKYKQVLEACALEQDLKVLSDGDLTEIGEKGINLSGGQKQRVSLARAVYQNKKIYIFDDPLSAVDAHVGKHLFEKVIGPKGLLRDKTRILVTHGITYLPYVDEIIVLHNGVVSEKGSYAELLANDGTFSEFLKNYMAEQDEEALNQELEGHPEEFKDEYRKRIALPISENDSDISFPSRRKQKRSVSKGGQRSEFSKTLGSQKISRELIVPKKLIKEETAEIGTVKWEIIGAFMKSGGWIATSLAIAFHILFLGALILGNLWLSAWTNDSFNPNVTLSKELTDYRCGIYGGIILLQLVTSGIASYGVAHGCVSASRLLHKNLLDRILKAPMSFFDTTPLGRILNRISRDVDQIDFNIPLMLRQWFFQAVPLIATIILISYGTPIFLVAVVPMGALYAIVMRVYITTVRQLRRIDSVRRSPIFVHFDETVSGASSIRAYQQTEKFVEKCDILTDHSQRAFYAYVVATRWLGNVLEILGGVVVLLASLLVVIQRDTLSSGIAGMSVSYSLQVAVYLNFYVRAAADLETYMVSVERVKEYSEVEKEAPWRIPNTRPSHKWPDKGTIEYENYSTRYRPGLDLVLKNLSCSIKAGEKVGVVGRTGAGKSSLALSLFRIIEASGGRINIDGVDISNLGLLDLRSSLTIIPQDPVIFSGTLRDNLDPCRKHTDSEIWEALSHSHLKAFVTSAYAGLDYECGENGEALSIGQRQLVCMARALLRKSNVLVLDEATAAIDLETDELIQTTIRTAFSNRTVITIAHRLNTIMDYDRVMVMADGNVVEFDSPSSLLQNENSVFKSMSKDAGL